MNPLCLCLTHSSLAANLAQLRAEKYFRPALDLAELRLDCMLDFSNPAALEQSLQKFCHELPSIPTELKYILTLRKIRDGGRCPDSLADSDYLAIVQRCLKVSPPAFLDLDLPLFRRVSGLLAQLQERGIRLLVSVHEFGPLPEDHKLQLLLAELRQWLPEADTWLKFALMVSSSQELLRFYRFARQMKKSDRNYVLLAMGEFGSSSRILRPHTGSAWTFCCGGEPVAPGQFSLNELVELYRYRSITEKTEIYGVIGNPVAHSRSPEIHNPAYRQRAWDAVYLRFRVDEPRAFLGLLELLPIRGVSVTVPHKEALAAMASRASEAVQLLGACNTFCRQGSGYFAENTDIDAFLQPLLDFSLSGKKAAIIGAGGAARAAVYALLKQGVDCEIYNRTLRRAAEFQSLFPVPLPGRVIQAARLEEGRHISPDCELLIQTSSVGMNGFDPVPAYHFRPGQIAYDLIYEPPETVFLQRARRAGAWVINGSAMLEKQALAQIKLFARAPS